MRPSTSTACPFAVRRDHWRGAIVLGLFVIWMASHPGVHRSTADIDAVVKLVVAALAAASCVVFGRRAAPQVRLAWM